MPVVQIADVVVPEIWGPYVQELTREKSELITSGIMVQSPELDAFATGAGTTYNCPLFNDLTGEDEVLSDSGALTPDKIGTDRMIGISNYRGRAWGSNDLAAALAGVDPAEAIAQRAAAWWARRLQATTLAILTGMMDAANMAGATLAPATEDGVGAGVNADADLLIDAEALLGDAGEQLAAVIMHSKVYYGLLKQNVIDFEQPSDQGQPIRSYMGKRVIVDDGMTAVAGATSGFKYSTYLFGAGALGYGEGTPKAPVETDRDVLSGVEYLVNRRYFTIHPQGMSFIGTPTGQSPTNAEFANGANWNRVLEQKNVKITRLITNG